MSVNWKIIIIPIELIYCEQVHKLLRNNYVIARQSYYMAFMTKYHSYDKVGEKVGRLYINCGKKNLKSWPR